MTKTGADSQTTWTVGSSVKIIAISLLAILLAVSLVVSMDESLFSTSFLTSYASSVKPTKSAPPRQHTTPSSSSLFHPSRPNLHIDPAIQHLLDSIREVTENALKSSASSASSPSTPGPVTENTNENLRAWRAAHPCKSREQLLPLYERMGKGVKPNPQWDAVLREYSNMHRVCRLAAGNLTKYFVDGSRSSGCKFMFATARNGLGNKLIHMTSSFLHAVLTQRVFIIPTDTSVPEVFCEPFEGSTWRIDFGLDSLRDRWNSSDEFFRMVDAAKRGNVTEPLYAARLDNYWGPNNRYARLQNYEDERYPNLRQVVGGSILRCEISSLTE